MRINYDNVIRQARSIYSEGDELKKIADDLNVMMGEIEQAWGGEASIEYRKACEELKIRVSRTSQTVKKVASDIETIANRIHEEDQRMAMMAVNIKNK